MNLKKTVVILTVGALALAAGLGFAGYRAVQAAAPTVAASAANGNVHAGFGRGIGGGYGSEDLANALGITVDELNAAYEAATDVALDQAVADGLITQAQADEIRERGAVIPFGGRWGGWLSENGIDYEALLAEALGITVEDLRAAQVQAFNARVDQAVANGNLTEEQADLLKGQYALRNSENFRSAMQAAFEAAVQAAVDEGVITQSQADRILESGSGLRFPGFGGGRGLPGGFGRHGGFGNPGPFAPEIVPPEGSSGL